MGIAVNLGFDNDPKIEKLDITGCTLLPVGFFLELIEQGVLGYDRNLADSTLTSSRAFLYMTKYMKGQKVSPYHAIAFKNGKLIEQDINLADINEIYIGGKCVGLLGWSVPIAQNAYTCSKLGRKAGFYLIDNGQSSLGGAEFEEKEFSLEKELEWERA